MTPDTRPIDGPPRRRLNVLRLSWLDVKLWGRLPVKFPFISAVGILALAMAIATGAIWSEIVSRRLYPTLPFPDGRSVVRLEVWNASRLLATPPSPRDFLTWQGRLTSVVALGAYRTFERNLVATDGLREAGRVAEISASAFATPYAVRDLHR